MNATTKSPAIDELLSKFMGKNRQYTIEQGLCMTCDGEAKQFKDELSVKEYTISGMCQDCQDKVFG